MSKGPIMPPQADIDRLLAAGFHPVVRWVDTSVASDRALKTVEALTTLDRREEQRKEASRIGGRKK